MKFSRIIIIVLDGFGVGELPDAALYDDVGSNTLGNMARVLGGLSLPNLEALGLGNIGEFDGISPRPHTVLPSPLEGEGGAKRQVRGVQACIGCYGKMAEVSAGKDTTTGHWEMTGIHLDKPFPVYPHGFPPEIIEPFKKAIGTDILANHMASGIEVIDRYGEEHIKTGFPIVYTSVDSVFQIAAHKDVIPVARLYEICLEARRLLTGRHGVGRIIARPFEGRPGSFRRTYERKDFSLMPPADTLLDIASGSGFPVVGIGKIDDIFSGRGITTKVHTEGNADGMQKTLDAVKKTGKGIIFTNLVDFDMLFGHRNDVAGYYGALREFDGWLPVLMAKMNADDLLFITADHGCDPVTPSTEHSREYVPLLVYGTGIKGGVDLGIRDTFSDLGATAAEALGLNINKGTSFLNNL